MQKGVLKKELIILVQSQRRLLYNNLEFPVEEVKRVMRPFFTIVCSG
jgi:hypothetical protein